MATCGRHGYFRTPSGEEYDHFCPRCNGMACKCENCGRVFVAQEPEVLCGGCERLADADDAHQPGTRYSGSLR